MQEGIHITANTEYAQLFGFSSADDLIGLPILDVLQPEDLSQFKLRFKKISQGQFEQGRFELRTQNPSVKNSALQVEFIPSGNEDEIQLNIECESTIQPSATIPAVTSSEKSQA